MKRLTVLLSVLLILSVLCIPISAYTEHIDNTVIFREKSMKISSDGCDCEIPVTGFDFLDKEVRETAYKLADSGENVRIEYDVYSYDKRITSVMLIATVDGRRIYHGIVGDTATSRILTLDDVLSKNGDAVSGDGFILTPHSIGITVNPDGKDGYVCVSPLKDNESVCNAVRNKTGIYPWEKLVAFTFDDGPSENTDKILSWLENHGQKATFFVLGCHIEGHEKQLEKMAEIGCEIGIHGYSHKDMRKLSNAEAAKEIGTTEELIYKACKVKPKVFRAPYGEFTKYTESLGYSLVKWSVDTLDWKKKNTEAVKNSIISCVRDGDVVLLHDIFPTSAEAFCEAADELCKRGYRLVSVSELFEFGEPDGKIHYRKEQ